MTEMKTKKCYTCQVEKYVEDFHLDNRRISKLCDNCKKCEKTRCNKKNQIHWKKRIIKCSKESDKKYGRLFEIKDYINKDYITHLLEKQNGYCYYCTMLMIYGIGNKRSDPFGLTVQRINNTLAHTQSNCILACLRCNEVCKFIPHAVMEIHGNNLREGIFKYCAYEHHSGDRVDLAENFKKTGWCKICSNLYERNRIKNKKRKLQE